MSLHELSPAEQAVQEPALADTGERLILEYDADSVNAAVHWQRYYDATQYVTPASTVLDYGCGTGYGIAYLATHTQGACVGIDKPESVAYATAHYPAANLQYSSLDITRPGATLGRFDLIVSFDVIEHLDDIDTYLANIAAQLRDETSIALISTPWSSRRANLAPLHNPYHTCELTLSEFVAVLERHFRIDDLTLETGMLARVRLLPAAGATDTAGAADEQPSAPPAAVPSRLTRPHLLALETELERLYLVEEQARQADDDLAQAAAWLRARQLAPASNPTERRLLLDRRAYTLRLPAAAQPLIARFDCAAPNLTAVEILLYAADGPGVVRVTCALYRSGSDSAALAGPVGPAAQVTRRVLLGPPALPARLVFPAQPDSAGAGYELHVQLAADAGAGPATAYIWCDADGAPLVQTLTRRYHWQGHPSYFQDVHFRYDLSTFPPSQAAPSARHVDAVAPLYATTDAMPVRLRKIAQALGARAAGAEIANYVRWRFGASSR